MKGLVGRLHARAVFDRRVRVLADRVADHLPQGGRVLDVGCGDGLLARRIGQRRPDLELHGIDVLVRDTTHIPVTPFDGRTIPHGDGAFDAVVLVDVVHHAEDPHRLLREVARVAGTAVVIKDHTRTGFLAEPTLRLMDWVGNAPHGVDLPYNYWTGPEWDEAWADAGLEPTSVDRSLPLYPPPLSWLFGRSLHFLARLEPGGAVRR